ncbi:MAG: hypothetical protein PVJ07_04855 [Anaerolineales bacterium]|jgi:hypothetical protein
MKMSSATSSPPRSLLITALVLACIGWPGIYLLFTFTQPRLGPRWLFFFLLTSAAAGTALPLVWLLHRRFGGRRATPANVMLRQALWAGFFASLCTWLQINRSLTLQLALLLAGGLILFEWLLGLVQRSARRIQR